MTLVPSFSDLLQVVAQDMTKPTRKTFQWIALGWIFARLRYVTRICDASGGLGKRHFCTFHRFFSAAVWSLDALGMTFLAWLEPWLDGKYITLAVDDTLARKRSRKMFGVGWHHDPMLKNIKAKTSWGHSWVVLSVVVRFPRLAERAFSLPILFRLYLNHEQSTKQRRVHRTRPELALQMVRKVCQTRPTRRFHLLGDMAYGGRGMRDGLPSNCELTSALRLDSRLYDDPELHPGVKRTRKRGERMPSPREMLDRRSRHTTVDVYGRRDKIRIASCLARTFHHPGRPIHVVAIESLSGKRGRQAFYSTITDTTPEQILLWYSERWSIEVAFQCAKQHLGFEEPPCWSRRAVERTAPMAMLFYSLIVSWFAVDGYRHWKLTTKPWYPSKTDPSFQDMLATLRCETLRQQVCSLHLGAVKQRKILKLLQNPALLGA